MKPRFFVKKLPKVNSLTSETLVIPQEKNKKVVEIKKDKNNKNKKNKQEEDMNIEDRINAAEAAMESLAPEVKVVKKERGLIERTESSKIIITEDNRQLLKD